MGPIQSHESLKVKEEDRIVGQGHEAGDIWGMKVNWPTLADLNIKEWDQLSRRPLEAKKDP